MEELLEVINVNKHYSKFDLKDFSFTIPSGSIVGFIGRNGAGKSTTLKGIMNLLHFDSGEVIFFGKNMKEYELDIKQDIGFAMSEVNYYPNKTIKSLVEVTSRFYKNFDMDKFNKLCDHFGISLNKKIQELSTGMKVKYNLALALSHNAKLLILDEPTSGLDPISRDEILDIFLSLVKQKGISILFSTHITSDLDKCADRILYIQNGIKQYEGTKDNFINSYKIVKGKLSDLSSSVESSCVSLKKQDDSFTALLHTNDVREDMNELFTISNPDLEEIMIYWERGKNHEEFVF